MLLASIVLLPLAAAAGRTRSVVHLTDVHVDPWFVAGSDAYDCYCETNAQCPRMGEECSQSLQDPAAFTAAGYFGSAEGDCATPLTLYDSAMSFISSLVPSLGSPTTNSVKPPPQLVYYTGDFTEAGAPYACVNMNSSAGDTLEAQQQVVNIITAGWNAARRATSGGKNNATAADVRMFGTLGNHDLVPGDLAFGTEAMAWLYTKLAELWGPDLGWDEAALETLRIGGYYSVLAAPDLTVISLNTNYLVWMNSEMKDKGSDAYGLGLGMLDWFEVELLKARDAGPHMRVHILGHIMPADGTSAEVYGELWLPGFYKRFELAIQRAGGSKLVKGMFWGHVHTDQWTISRECTEQDVDHGRQNNESDYSHCTGAAMAVMLAGPSLTEGWPATDPAFRVLEFSAEPDTSRWGLLDAHTFAADLNEGNSPPGTDRRSHHEKDLRWKLLYSFTDKFGMRELSPSSFEKLASRMRHPFSFEWEQYRGKGNGSIYCSGYNSTSAPFTAHHPCTTPCRGDCKDVWVAWLNGSQSQQPPLPPAKPLCCDAKEGMPCPYQALCNGESANKTACTGDFGVSCFWNVSVPGCL